MMRNTNILMKGATLLDGRGTPAYRADLLIREGKIAEIGNVPSGSCEIVSCAGLHVAPGFIDIHSHSDKEVLQHLPNKILQGITTEVVGNCGFSLFPSLPNLEGVRYTGEIFDGEPAEGMATTEEYFSAVEKAGPLVNVAALTGHVALRIHAMKMRREAGEAELQHMQRTLNDCLSTGSVGFSTGLNCMPSSFADRAELIRLCRELKPYDAVYTTHLRDYKFNVVEAVAEAIQVARSAEIPVQISHMQVVGKKNWDKLDVALELIEKAHQEGLDIGMDAYPYLAGSCSLIQFLPAWCQAGGIQNLLRHLDSRVKLEEIASETDAGMSNSWDDLIVSGVRSPENKPILGKSIALIAEQRGKLASNTALELLRKEEGYVYVISFNSNEENLRKVLTHPLTSVITDGMVMEGLSHPRTFGTYPKFLGEYVRDKHWMTLEEAVVKTSALAARRFRLEGRGTIEPSNWADITVFDAAKIGTRSDYDNPAQDPEGIHHVLVNGQFGVRNGKLTGRRAGMVLPHKK